MSILFIVCLTLSACAMPTEQRDADGQPASKADDAKSQEDDKEPLSQRIRRISPRRYFSH